jgi:hydroxymethylbilane synthase
MVATMLEGAHEGLTVDLVEVRTSGDRIQDVPLGPHLGQAFFTKEIEDALLDGRVDLAVHSCKDLATRLPEGLALGAIPSREDPRDALVSAGRRLDELPAGARIGTSSPRRKNFLARARPDLVLVDQRGNVPTRVAAADEGRVDAVILAVSGLKRLDLGNRIVEILDPEIMLPAAAQGALAIQIRADEDETAATVGVLDDLVARSEITAERACLHHLGAGCQAPVGVLARMEGDRLLLRAGVVTPELAARAEAEGPPAQAAEVGIRAAQELLDQMDLPSLRDAAWAGPPPRAGGAP